MKSPTVILLLVGRPHETIKEAGKPYLIKNFSSSITLIQGEKNILVDTGVIGQEKELLKALKKRGVRPEQIDIIINTHEHFDHTSNNYLFPNARRIISHYEWLPDATCLDWKIDGVVDYEREIMHGVRTIWTQGHAFDHISVVVETGKKTIVIAGDAIREKYLQGEPVPSHYHMREKYVENVKRILAMADEIIPGHGPIITKDKILEYRKKWKVE
jgi:glyoxylase-like metal-dependent hydrolase (beta-lactamase superfamily II)